MNNNLPSCLHNIDIHSVIDVFQITFRGFYFILNRAYYYITMDKNFEDYYGILRIDQNASNAVIRKAYLDLVMKHHPDKNLGQTAKQLEFCKRIIKAYQVLSDPMQRKEYDRNYQDRKKRQQTNASQQGRGNKESHGSNSQKNGHFSGNQEKKKYEHRPKSEHKKENNHNGHSSYNQERSHQQNTGQQRRPNSEQKEKPKPHYNHNAHSSGKQGRHDWRRQDERDRNQSNFKNRDHAYYQESWQEDYDLYEMLGLRNNATQNYIQNAYFNLTQRFSQENANPATTKIYAKILKAYIILSDPELRNNYDGRSNNRNQVARTYGTFAFLDDELFDGTNSDASTCVKGISVGCIGCGLALYVVLKWVGKALVFTLTHLVKCMCSGCRGNQNTH